ncbi:MAG: M48 family metallopeptidase [Gammaproteobacteria bacterium]
MNKLLLPLVFGSILLGACATSPTGRSQFAFMPEDQLDAMGLQAFENLKSEKAVSTDPKVNAYVQCIAGAITREVGGNWEVVVFKDPSLNAFALPGKKIGVHTGMVELVDNQHMLAAVIGHEVAHVLSRHSNERMSQEFAVQSGLSLIQAVSAPQTALGKTAIGLLGVGAQYGVILPYSRLHESEADVLGLELMARAGFDPTQSIPLWQKMDRASQQQPAEFLSTHPSHSTRIQELNQDMPKALEIRRQANAVGKNPRCD